MMRIGGSRGLAVAGLWRQALPGGDWQLIDFQRSLKQIVLSYG